VEESQSSEGIHKKRQILNKMNQNSANSGKFILNTEVHNTQRRLASREKPDDTSHSPMLSPPESPSQFIKNLLLVEDNVHSLEASSN
jgi:hypothetical protein